VLISFRISRAFVSLLGWGLFFWIWCALPMSLFYRDACPGISFHFSGVDQHCHLHCQTSLAAYCECTSNMRLFPLIYFNSPFLHSVIDHINGGLEFHWTFMCG
jgi:hypothetical protein